MKLVKMATGINISGVRYHKHDLVLIIENESIMIINDQLPGSMTSLTVDCLGYSETAIKTIMENSKSFNFIK